ncbi:MAG TPA: aldehyde ferredoxin oxidoreductase family protein, partial [Thermoleophilia bacterium]|nr:aldehyde ferredoxin oxidoreductase family protein [Thermoleophilia bacterium]
MGDLLRIDLTTRTSAQETVPPELIKELIGPKGIGTYYLRNEVGPEVDPLSPQAKLIFVSGPMAGTAMLGSNRYSLYYVSPLTNGYGECYAGGNVAPQFAKTGFKVVIVEGQADAPVYLEISEAGVEFHSAADLWGLDAFETEDKILERTAHKRAQACVIGPAGEKLVRFACVNNDYWHQLGRGGPGAVFGSKNLKGIVWHGDQKVEVARPDDFKALVRDMVERSKDDPGVAAYQRGGTLNMVRTMNGANAFPTRYWRKGTVDGFEKISVETMLEKHGTRTEVCPPCVMKCVKHNFVFEGRHKGLECEGPEYETAYVFGGLCEIVDFAEIMWLNDICDRLGVDTITAGNLCALAIEASHRGLIDEKMEFGDPDCVAEFLRKMALREGIGDVWAEGVLRVEKEIPELKGVAVHCKGMEPAGYEPRVMKGMGLGFAVTARGACHLRATMYKPELMGLTDPRAWEDKAPVYCDWEDRLTIMDCLIYCRFYRDLVTWPYITQVVNATVGTDYTEEDLHRVANRIVTMTHDFNAARGIGRESETLPEWVTDKPMEDENGYDLPQSELAAMVAHYYRIRGWAEPAEV